MAAILPYRRHKMSVVKVIELIAESDQSWEAAAQAAVTHAGRTIRNIKSL